MNTKNELHTTANNMCCKYSRFYESCRTCPMSASYEEPSESTGPECPSFSNGAVITITAN